MDKTVIPKKRLLSPGLFDIIQSSVPLPHVDLVILRRGRGGDIETLLIKRKIPPEKGKWCIVGGRVLKDERLAQAIRRHSRRELGVSVSVIPPWKSTEPLKVCDNPKADPRKHAITMLYPVQIKRGKLRPEGPELSEWKWFPIEKLPKVMGFSHSDEVKAVLRALEKKEWRGIF